MTADLWREVDAYIVDSLVGADAALDHAQASAEAAGLPRIAVSAAQGKMLHLMAKSIGARRILEIGTLGGYSAIWLARALPESGRLVTLELDAWHAGVARASLAHAGLSAKVEVRVGDANDLLPAIQGPFDFTFIDADKESNAAYFAQALRLSRPGSVIMVDNVVRAGKVIDPDGGPQAAGVRRMFELVRNEPRVSATAVQTVGDKGHDGFLMAVVL